MTLCIVWRRNNTIHFASDSRLTLATNSSADVGIKVMGLPYRIYAPSGIGQEPEVEREGEIGMCFAGSAVNSLMLKETVATIVRELQYVPGYNEPTVEAVARFIFRAYVVISKQVCMTSIAGLGRAELIVSGYCSRASAPRTFKMETDDLNRHHFSEVLQQDDEFILFGSGSRSKNIKLCTKPTDQDLLDCLRSVIDDPDTESVGGPIQYGHLNGERFKSFGIADRKSAVHLWRGALDMNDPELGTTGQALSCRYAYLDPFQVFAQTAS